MVKRGQGLNATTDFNVTSGGSLTLGSFAQARTDLNALSADSSYRLAVILWKPLWIEEVVAELRRHCPGLIFYRSHIDNKFQLVCYQSSPSAEKDYATTISWDAHICQDYPFRVTETPIDEIYTRIYVHYRWFAPQSQTIRTAFVTPSGSDDGEGNDDATRESNASTYETRYGTQNVWEGSFPWIIDKDVAVALRNYYFDRLSQSLLRVEFTSFLNLSDLRLGHIINFSDDIDSHVVYPKYGDTTTWASKDYQATEIRRSHTDRGELYHVKALEVT